MSKIKVECVKKLRNNRGTIINYTLRDENGNVFQATSEQIKTEMKGKRYEFTNLQLDSLGRLVDKTDKNAINAAKMNEALYREFENAYDNLMNGKQVEFGFIDYGKKFNTSSCEHMINEVIQSDDDLAEKYMTEILPMFEKFVLQKGGKMPYKLQIKSRNGVFEKVLYSLEKPEEHMTDYIKMDLGRKAYYYKPENYMIRAYRLDTPNQLINNIYVAPDMSIVSLKQGSRNIQPVAGQSEQGLNKVLEQTYGMLMNSDGIGFGFIKFNGQIWDLMSEKKIERALKANGVNLYPLEVASKFETYIKQKNNGSINKIHVKSKDGVVELIYYSVEPAEVLVSSFVDDYMKGANRAYYTNPNNYLIAGSKLNGNSVQECDVHIESDMSSVRTLDHDSKGKVNRQKGYAKKVTSTDAYTEKGQNTSQTQTKSQKFDLGDFIDQVLQNIAKRWIKRGIRRSIFDLFRR